MQLYMERMVLGEWWMKECRKEAEAYGSVSSVNTWQVYRDLEPRPEVRGRIDFRVRESKEGIITVLNTRILVQQPVELAEGVERP